MIKSISFVVELINVDTEQPSIIVRLMDGRPVSVFSDISSLGEEIRTLLHVAACEGREHDEHDEHDK